MNYAAQYVSGIFEGELDFLIGIVKPCWARQFDARMLRRPAKMLIFDDPSNDLDIVTSEALVRSSVLFSSQGLDPGFSRSSSLIQTSDRYLGLEGFLDLNFSRNALGTQSANAVANEFVTARGRQASSQRGNPDLINRQTNRTSNHFVTFLQDTSRAKGSRTNLLNADTALALSQTKAPAQTASSSSVKPLRAWQAVDTA